MVFLEYCNMRLMTVFLMISLALCNFAVAQVPPKQTKMYKWVDENGTVHYSTSPDTPAAAEELTLRKGPAKPEVGPLAAVADPEEIARCEQLRKNLRLLESSNTQLEIEEAGKRRPMTAEERAPQLKATREMLERCTSVPAPTP